MVNMASIARRRRRSCYNSISSITTIHTITYHISINRLFLNDSMVLSDEWQPRPAGSRGNPDFSYYCFSLKRFAKLISQNKEMDKRSYKWNSFSSHCYDLNSRDRSAEYRQEVIFLKDPYRSVPSYILILMFYQQYLFWNESS